jgi:hypothetical protein
MAGLKAVILNFDILSTKQECYPSTIPSQLCSSMLKKESVRFRILTFHFILHIQGVTGGTDQTSGGCSLC